MVEGRGGGEMCRVVSTDEKNGGGCVDVGVRGNTGYMEGGGGGVVACVEGKEMSCKCLVILVIVEEGVAALTRAGNTVKSTSCLVEKEGRRKAAVRVQKKREKLGAVSSVVVRPSRVLGT